MQLTRTHRILIGLVVAGAVLIASIGFAGSYAAVRELALQKGFGNFSLVFPIGIDAGICVLLALDLLLTWLRIPFPLLRQTAWLLTAATVAFNGAAAWPDPLGVGMHAVIPVLFVVSVEAARHAVGRIADITADKHMEGVRLTRWLLSPVPTFRLWRRMKLWELRSYEQVIKLEQDRLIYQARLQARFGRNWRRKAPVESLMPLRLAKYGVPLADTGPAGLAAAGIEPALLPPAPALAEMRERQSLLVDDSQVDAQTLLSGDVQGSQPEGVNPWFVVSRHSSREEREPDLADGRSGDEPEAQTVDRPQAENREETLYTVFFEYVRQTGLFPTARQFGLHVGALGFNVPQPDEAAYTERFEERFQQELDAGLDWNADAYEDVAVGQESSNPSSDDARSPEPVGASADRTGGNPRRTVQIRIPAQQDPNLTDEDAEPQPGEPAPEAGPRDEGEEEPPSALRGPSLVEFHYRAMPREEQHRSANALAPMLAEATGYKVGTVRKYIGEIKKADKAAAALAVER
ncbi:DUF2637 domain-containing protein [Streptomyces sp. NPDC097727]|uniref:DUF2637 domain-containing protein n=1 Tax=Streptomyces sp. NPDC097727 TaxID=3366092 RepID=UPI00382309CD